MKRWVRNHPPKQILPEIRGGFGISNFFPLKPRPSGLGAQKPNRLFCKRTDIRGDTRKCKEGARKMARHHGAKAVCRGQTNVGKKS